MRGEKGQAKQEVEQVQETGIKPVVIEEICRLAEQYNVEKVILFGSRARGDYGRASDIDLAVYGGEISRFALDVDEETSTPLRFDVIDLSRDVQEELRQAIEKEGKIIYEKISKLCLPPACAGKGRAGEA